MKRLLLVVCLLLSGIASASDYITVTGTGKSFEEAKQQAFRKAIEFKVGSTVLSDVETKNYRRIKDEIYIYSSGYVDDYKIIQQEPNVHGITVLLDVLVSESKIKNRIIAEGKSSKEFDGDRHGSQIATLLYEREQGDKVLGKILSEFPTKSFNITQSNNYNITLDYNRKPILNISYELSWNYEFVKTFRETVGLISNCKPSFNKPCVSGVVVMVKDPKDWVLGKKTESFFSDLNRVDQIHNYFVANSPRIIARFYDLKGNVIYGLCHNPKFIWGGNESFYSTGQRNLTTIYGNTKEKGIIQTTLPLTIIDNTSKIELSVESEIVCRN